MKRRILSFVVGICLVLGLVPTTLLSDFLSVTAEAAETSGTCGDDLTWVYDEDTNKLTIFGNGAMEDYECGNAPWNAVRSEIVSVEIESGVESIGDFAFYDCSSLADVSIPESVSSIGTYAFDYCIGLTEIIIPDGVITIGSDAFGYCDSLTSVSIGDSVETIGNYAFYECAALTDITLPDGLQEIGAYAFYNCQSMREITIPDSVENIGDSSFYSCKSLTEVIIPDSVSEIGSSAFDYCTSLKMVIVGENVTSFMGGFIGCSALETVVFKGDSPTSGYIYNFKKLTLTAYVPANNSTWTEDMMELWGSGSYVTWKEYYGTYPEIYSIDSGEIIEEATCTDAGVIDYTCIICGQVIEQEISATGHDWSDVGTWIWEENDSGYSASISFACKNNSEHLYTPDVTVGISKTKDATCENSGYIRYYASAIGPNGDTYLDEIVVEVAATGHSYTNNICDGCGAVKRSTLTEDDVSLLESVYTYSGSAIEAAINISVNGTTLIEGTDYIVEYSNNVDIGTASASITGTGSYDGTVIITFEIEAQSLSSSNVSLSYTSKTYTGSAFSPTVTVKNANGTTLTKGTDYTVSTPSGRKNAGTYTYTITGTGNYTGTVKKTLTIKPVSIKISSSAYVSCKLSSTSYTYNGSAKKPSVTLKVKVNGSTKTLSKSSSSGYTVSYKNNTKIGKATVTITGTGNYSGTITKTFKILPKKGTISSLKSSAKKKMTVKWKTISGSVTKYQVRYRVKGTSTWTTKTYSSSTKSKTITGLKSGKTYQVQVRAYKTVSGTKYYGSWSSTKTVKVK